MELGYIGTPQNFLRIHVNTKPCRIISAGQKLHYYYQLGEKPKFLR